jgi:hypothetical protein
MFVLETQRLILRQYKDEDDVSLEIGHREQGDYHKLNYNRFEVSQS